MKVVFLLILIFTSYVYIQGQPIPLYQGGAFLDWNPSPATEPLTLAEFNDMATRAGIINNRMNLNSNTAPTPCIAVLQGQDEGYLLVPSPTSAGYAFLPSDGLCGCETCVRLSRCCGDILDAAGNIVAACYIPVQCDKAGACLRNFECLGIQSTTPTLPASNVSSYVANPTNTNTSPPCFKFSPAPAGTNGFSAIQVTQGYGFAVQQCSTGTSCLAVTPCCATPRVPCLSFTPCCVPLGSRVASNCLYVERCVVPQPYISGEMEIGNPTIP